MTTSTPSMAHAHLVNVASSWLKKVWRCPVIATELVTTPGEVCDAIGWTSNGRSVVVECKTSLADFTADKKKPFRKHSALGVGDFRFFLAETGLLRAEMIPEEWGLLEVTAGDVRVVERSHAADCFCRETHPRRVDYCAPAFTAKAHEREAIMLMSILRRLAGPVGIRGRLTVSIKPFELDERGQKVAK